jgi:hypothetical protein
MTLRLAAPLLCVLLLACSDDAQPLSTLTREQLMDPETCKSCHPTHYREWKASMHAYAAQDPVFRAMNELGQRETDGGMGDFCVQCHAPMAVREGATSDGLNLDDVPEHLQGVTCYFCHNVESVEGDHNAQLTLANDTTMRGALKDPVRPSAHRVTRSHFMQRGNPESSRMCGACHDIVNGHGVHLERTFAEYEASIFAGSDGFMSCIGCHMTQRKDFAAVDEDSYVGLRDHVSSHLFTGVDVALTDWPDREAYKRAVECGLSDGAFFFEPSLDFDGQGNISVVVETNAGHNSPSGSAQDRRMWVELTAFDKDGEVVCTNGAVPDDEAVVTFNNDMPMRCNTNPGVAPFRDIMFDAEGRETHMFWRAAPSDEWPDGFSNFTVQPQQLGGSLDHGQKVTFNIPRDSTNSWPARLRLRLRIRPMDHDVLEELIDEGLLDESIPDQVPTFTIPGGERELLLVGEQYEWQPTPPRRLDCKAVACEFTPDAPDCD